MKIAFNAYFLSGKKAGIGHYSQNILDALKQLSDGVKYNEVSNRFDLNKFIFEQIYLPGQLLLRRPKLFFSPSMILPFFNPVPSVMVVYDLVFKLFPEYYRGRLNLFYLNLFFGRSVTKAKKIIAISENTKNDLVRLYDVEASKVVVTPLAASVKFCVIDDKKRLSGVRTRYDLPDKFILFVGTIEPRKNVKRLIQAYLTLSNELRAEYKLVLCGQMGWGSKELVDWYTTQKEQGSVIFLNYISGDDLLLLYNLASLFVYPSFYEGFGLPVLEAMACGVPTITSNTSSMPEAAGDAAILIDPNNTIELSKSMRQVLQDKQLADKMRLQGLEQAKKFSWDKTAEATLEVFQGVLGAK